VAYTSADLDAVRAARLRGIRTVQYADRQVTYSSDQELRQVEADIARVLASSSHRTKQFRVVATKGFD